MDKLRAHDHMPDRSEPIYTDRLDLILKKLEKIDKKLTRMAMNESLKGGK